jgi:hypothetical protein
LGSGQTVTAAEEKSLPSFLPESGRKVDKKTP